MRDCSCLRRPGRLQVDGHVRVDVFLRSRRRRDAGAVIDLLGAHRLSPARSPAVLAAVLGALCGALLGHVRALARERAGCRSFICSRPSFRFSPFCSACRASRRRSAPRWFSLGPRGRNPPPLRGRLNWRDAPCGCHGGRGLRGAARRLSGGADACRRVARCSPPPARLRA